jgi:hypothetical protein
MIEVPAPHRPANKNAVIVAKFEYTRNQKRRRVTQLEPNEVWPQQTYRN